MEEIDLVEARISPILGEKAGVFQEFEPDNIPLDVYCWAPTEDHPVWTLVTSGMRDHKMRAPEDMEEYSRSEYVLTLPPDWPLLDNDDPTSEEAQFNYWPVYMLKQTARFSKEFDTWLGYGHTIQAGMELTDTYPDTDFCGLVLGQPLTLDADDDLLETPYADGVVHFLGLYPIYRREMEFGMAGESLKLLDKLEDANIYEGLIPNRPAVM